MRFIGLSHGFSWPSDKPSLQSMGYASCKKSLVSECKYVKEVNNAGLVGPSQKTACAKEALQQSVDIRSAITIAKLVSNVSC